jgi:uncharacterized membrane protein
MHLLKKISLGLLVAGYLIAGINHFVSAPFYLKIIPPYMPLPHLLNVVAGCCEIVFALLLIPAKTRVWAAWGIVLLLIVFIPVHLQMVIDAPFKIGSLRVGIWLAWIRLVILQPLLIWWAWWHTRPDLKP